MTYSEISCCVGVNRTDPGKVQAIAESIREHGWQGPPILAVPDMGRLITGSHRLDALQLLCEEDPFWDPDELGDIAEDVTDIVCDYCEREGVDIGEIPCNSLRNVFAGTRIEQSAEQHDEW